MMRNTQRKIMSMSIEAINVCKLKVVPHPLLLLKRSFQETSFQTVLSFTFEPGKVSRIAE